MNNKLSEFVNQYHSVFRNRNLNLDSNDKLPIGEFDRYTLSGIDGHVLVKRNLALLFENFWTFSFQIPQALNRH